MSIRAACVPYSERVDCYGVTLELRASSPAFLRHLRGCLPPPCARTEARPSRVYAARQQQPVCACGRRHKGLAAADGRAEFRGQDATGLFVHMRMRLWHYVVSHSPRYLFVHAGVVAFGGKAVVIPGDSMSGKTTLVSALLRAGGTYYSDEFAVIDARGLIHPFRQPLGMRRPGSRDQTDVPASRLTRRLGRTPVRAALLVSTRFVEGERWTPTPLSRGEAVMALVGNSAGVRRTPARGLAVLTKATEHVVGLQGPRGDADDTAAQIVAYLRQLHPHPR